jgi:hypothetical protein
MELLASGERIDYLLKNRVIDVEEFIDTVGRGPAVAPSSTPCSSRSSWGLAGPGQRSTRRPHHPRA